MRKVLSIILMCGVLVSALAACGSKQNSASNNEVVSSNETGSETNQETEQPKETSFLPPAEHSNHIAPKADVGQKYNIKQMDFIKDKDGAFRRVGYFDESHVVVGGNAVYDFDGNLLFDEQKILDAYPKRLSYATIGGNAHRDYVGIGVNVDNCNALLYNYKNNSFFNFDSEGIEPLDLYENYMVVSKYDAEKKKSYYSVIDYNNKTIIPFDADFFIRYIGKDFIFANKNQKDYILDMSGNVIRELKNTYSDTSLSPEGLAREERFTFTNLEDQMTDYIIGEIGHKKESEEFISSYSYYLIDKKGNEIYLTDKVAAIEDSCRMVSQYNGKSYLIEYLDDYFEDNGNKFQKRQLIDENKNIIIKPCFELSGYINGYCRVGEFDEQSNTIKYSLIDLDGNAIETYSCTINSNINGQVKDFSIVDEQGLYVLTTYNGDSTVYTIKDTAGNTVYTSGTKLVMLGNGIFGMNGTVGSEYEYLIKITKA